MYPAGETSWVFASPNDRAVGPERTMNEAFPASRTGPAFRFADHARDFDGNRFVYAVLSRRARGVSIGVNLSPDKSCNFGCVYCQVDRTVPPVVRQVDEDVLLAELAAMLDAAAQGALSARARAEGAPDPLCRIADVAFSGDGEPTSYPRFAEILSAVGRLVDERLPGTPITLITNATLFHRPEVRAALDELARRGGAVWAKLDAGTEGYYRTINASGVPFARVLDNIREEAVRHPLVVQSLFMEGAVPGAVAPVSVAPAEGEIAAWAGRLAAIVAAGGRLRGVQVTTVARRPPHPEVRALPPDRLEAIAAIAREAVPGVPVEVFASAPANPATDRVSPRSTKGGAA